MKKLCPLFVVGLVLFEPTFAMPTAQSSGQTAKKLNVLFIFSDDQRADTIAALGNRRIKTPHLDKLVREGTSFRRAYCMGARQGAVCVPSRAMVLTGRTLFRVDENLKQQTTWPEHLAKAGYFTFLTGKWHNGIDSALRCFLLGKSVFFGGMGDPNRLPLADFSSDKKVTNQRKSTKHSVEQFTDETVAFLRNHKKDKPFLAYVSFNLPHDPRVAPKKYHDDYNANKPPLPPNFLPVHPFNNGDMVLRDEHLSPWPRTPEGVRQHLADYYACITFMDEQIGRIMATLKETGQYENTIVIFVSDSGLAIGSHGLFGKQNLYDHSMRVPFIIAGPGLPKGKSSDAFVYLLDLFPTVCELAGLEIPEGVEGKSLAPILRGQATKVRDSVFLAYRDVQRAIRDDRWKLIRYPQINKTQLFDMANDPHEIKDLSTDPRQATKIKELTTLLERWQRDSGDTLPLTSAAPRNPAFMPPVPNKPNVLLILTDDQRFDLLGCAGHPILKTPNIDRLAKHGVRFRNTFVSTSICAASRASILTGKYERSHKFTFSTPPIATEHCEKSFPMLLKRAGYRTGLIGKFGVTVATGQQAKMFDVFNPIGWPFLKKQGSGELRHIDQIATDQAIVFLQKQSPKQPFCLSLCFNSPHAEDGKLDNLYPWPKTVDGLYGDVPIPPPPLVEEKHFQAHPEFMRKSLNRVRWHWQFDTPEKYAKNVRAYYRMITGIDHEIGRLMAELKKLGLADNTIVVFTSDNGYFLGERGFSGKWVHYEESLRVPLIIVDPQLPKELQGRTADAMAVNVDLAPTIVDWAELPREEKHQGRSLVALVRGEKVASWRTDFFCEHLFVHPEIPRWEGVRGERYVYARYLDQKPAYEYLHDLQQDPQEIRNLALEGGVGPILQRMRRRCDELRDTYAEQ